jgi:hypothetical protein
MSTAIKNNKNQMKKLKEDSNPTMKDIDEMVGVFGNYEQPTSTDSED